VTEAISAFMINHQRLHTLRSLAPSSAAAVGINGLTMQSMLREGRNRSISDTILSQTDKRNIEYEWRNIDYCLIDEISMVGCHMLARFHKITTIAKHTQPTVPFGGINMIFLGDFVQYPPVLDRPLYSNLLAPNETLDETLMDTTQEKKRRTITERDIQCKVGRALWLQVNTVFFLTEQMRNRDPLFMALQSRLRIGECTDVSLRRKDCL
jgi:PIF1-like helicase